MFAGQKNLGIDKIETVKVYWDLVVYPPNQALKKFIFLTYIWGTKCTFKNVIKIKHWVFTVLDGENSSGQNKTSYTLLGT